MYAQIRAVVQGIVGDGGGAGMEILAIGESMPFPGYIGLENAKLTQADYPEYNILSLPMADDSFDAVVADQVLEHVEGNPFTAMSESVRVTRPGGLIIHTTCFLNQIHCAPQDFWRFTPYAMRLLCRGVAEPIEVGAWGGLVSFPVTALHLRFRPVPEAKWRPMHWLATRDNPKWPVTTWVVARKPMGVDEDDLRYDPSPPPVEKAPDRHGSTGRWWERGE